MTIALTGKIWCGTDLSEEQRQCYHRCPQLCHPIGTRGSRQRWLWCDTNPLHHIRSLSYRFPIIESEGCNATWSSTQSTKVPDIPGMARCQEKYSMKHPHILELQRWTSSRRWNDLQNPEASDPSIPGTWNSQGLTCWWFRGGEDPVRAKECAYWPGVTGDIKEYIKGCNMCQSMKPSQQKDPVNPHDVLSGPWEKAGINIFQYGSCKYLLVEDYFSNFPLIRVLNNPMATHTINILKTMFSEHGVPAHVFMDQGRQFWEFPKCYRFKIIHSTPRYPQSSGFIELMGKVMKLMMSKADQAREDVDSVH